MYIKYIFVFCREVPTTYAEPEVTAAVDVATTDTLGAAPADHDYACQPAQVAEQLEAARKMLAELEHPLSFGV
jgi:hypothetical protein